ncbi:MAG TPA: glycosyltransferase family 1 protein [Mucilaginibacter sp.]|nr:glycosyltransferase family 1 protein [Mucilaginibacter sp.]
MNNKNKRIAFISDHASPLACIGTVDTGGQNVYVAQLAKHLAAKGYLVDIYTRRDDAGADEIVDWQKGIRVIHVKAGPECNVVKEEMLQYMQEFQANMTRFIIGNHLHYQLIHANFFMSGLVAAGIKKELDIPFVITFHALGCVRRIYQADKDKFPEERVEIEKMIVREANHIIAECPQDRDDLIAHYRAHPRKISIVPCGFSSSEFYPVEKTVARKNLGLPSDCHILLQLGRMVERKGIDNVIKSMAYLKSTAGKDFRLVIVGGDSENMAESACSEYKRLHTIARRLKLTDKILFAGRKDRDQLKFYYNAADLFITTPWYEPFGITPLEAMACGTPVVGANVGGIKFSVKDGVTGGLVPPKQPKKLAGKITEIIGDREKLNNMSRNAIDHVNTWFTWAKVAEQTDELYRYVSNGERKPASALINIGRDNRAA